MLQLKNIVKDYDVGDGGKVHALRGVDIEFRENEFVSILGPSGKTSLWRCWGLPAAVKRRCSISSAVWIATPTAIW